MHYTDQLQQFFSSLYPLQEKEMNEFLRIWTPFNAKRKELLTRAGETEKYLYFVLSGIQRIYYYDEKEREATIVFTYPPSFSGVADSFLNQSPSLFYCETLTPSKMMRTTFTDLDALMLQFHNIERLVRISTNAALGGVLHRMAEVQCFSSEEKFRSLLKRSPHILNMIPHKYIASYIGIDPTNFSKLLATIRI